jgi:hypothetical protein
MDPVPYPVFIKVPDIDIIRDYLAQKDGKVVAEPSVDAEKVRGDDAQYPVDGGRQYLFGPFREDPLKQGAGKKKYLGDEAY